MDREFDMKRVAFLRLEDEWIQIVTGSLEDCPCPWSSKAPGQPPEPGLSFSQFNDVWEERKTFCPVSAVRAMAEDWVDTKGDFDE
jgi:hypothetical protein